MTLKKTKRKSPSSSKSKSKKITKEVVLTRKEFEMMEYPYRFLEISKTEMMRDFSQLRKYRGKVLKYNPTKKNLTPFKNGRFLVFVENYHKNEPLYRITDYFSHECRVRCTVAIAENNHILDLFQSSKKHILKELKERGEKLTFHNINEYLYRHHKECTYFNTTMVMNILNLFKPKRWLDCSAGWGDRLVGAIAYGCEYVGVDPSKCMRPKYKQIIKTLASPAKQSKYKVICDGFEKVKIKKNYFDLVFTSPPFFDFEVYENNNNQSVQQFNTVDNWKKYFLFPLIDKSYSALRVGGYLALYITDFKGSPYIKDMKNYLKKKYKDLFRYEGDFHFWYEDAPKKIRIIYVWKKIN
jgi:23S rRNA A1618 N6-methylase RlmF